MIGTLPKAWSFTALDAFESCPRQYWHEKVDPARPKVPATKEMLWGREVHIKFEKYLLYKTPLSADLQVHAEFLDAFRAQPGEIAGEEEINLDLGLQACGKWDKRIWYRGQIDAVKRNGPHTHLLDHKTGKFKSDFRQLKSFAFHEFRTKPHVETVKADYYWTQTRGTSGETYHRSQMWDLLREFAPALTRFANAFKNDVWQPKQSGLCNGWCSVTTCEYWKPKRK